MQVGITGWRGFIGGHLSREISKSSLFCGDMRRLADVKTFVDGCDRIYHVAGCNRAEEGDILANNLVSTGNLILALKSLNNEAHVIFVSSKQAEWNPKSEYGLTKRLEEEIVKQVESWCIFRVPNVYGPGARPFYNSVVATFAHQIVHDKQVTINNPSEAREFVYIDDLISQLCKPRLKGYVDVTGERMTVGQVYEALKSGSHPKLKECLDYYKVLSS